MKLIGTLIVFATLSFNSLSQAYVKPVIDGTFNQNSCNNAVICEAYGLPPLAFIVLEDGNANWPEQYVFDGDTVQNLCVADYPSVNTHRLSVFNSNGYIDHYLLFATPLPQHLNYTILNYVAPTTDTSYDGSMTLQFDSSNVLQSYDLQLGDQNWVVPDTTQIDAYTLQFDSLHAGYWYIGVSNPNNLYDYTEFRVYVGDMTNNYINTGLDVDLAVQHDSNNCDGWILAHPVNATGNLFNVWNDDTYNHELSLNLCPGVYSVYSYETDIQTAEYAAGSIDTIVIANDGTSYIDSSIYTNVVQDTTYFNGVNCNFDYNAPIDSITYLEDTVYNNPPLVIVNFEMTMYQDSSSVTYADSLVMLNDSLIMLDVVIYCGGIPKPLNWEGYPMVNEKNAFNARRIAYLRGAESHTFFQNGVGLSETEIIDVMLYPNPAGDQIFLEFSSPVKATVSMSNMQGKMVYTSEQISGAYEAFDISGIPAGVYVLRVETERGIVFKKFIKE